MKPILKYRGGKSKEIPEFIDYIPKFDTYYEPFFGGGATYFYLEPERAFISDVNEPLITFYQEISGNNFIKVKKELLDLQIQYEANRKLFMERKSRMPNDRVEDPNDALYYQIRDMFNGKIETKYEKATLYYFINKTAYSGMIRYNKSGEFNVPYGRYANFNTELLKESHHALLSHTEIHNASYEKSFEKASENDFIYLDPPYDTIFSDYGNEKITGDFGEMEHRKLAEDFKNLSAPALMIVGETDLITELYSDYIKGNYAKSYSVNIRNRFKSKANHLIITNYK
ncbi:DNA adenine methylase [Lactococcus piscium]|uniref:Site-specific DNA-methyltransferase (adenine-specific) n=1 Tax=Pseudolactococcus piscium MKFS47 TaxID=297352 RepID=A0A0D6DYE3_9LACT|nr:Dam family site-specific DNA-(adenine-N6)-methyltransferase [Lactococcus piscium]CEN28977.1 Type II DNA modification methylase [Lactococcus piscium MKFS47]